MAGISPKLPLARSATDGYWALNKTVFETTKQNFKNLILTNPGERVMDPLFGVGLVSFLFEQKGGFVEDAIKAKIHEQTNIYLPHVNLLNIQISDSSKNAEMSPNFLLVRIFYKLLPLNKDDVLDIKIDPDEI